MKLTISEIKIELENLAQNLENKLGSLVESNPIYDDRRIEINKQIDSINEALDALDSVDWGAQE